MGTLADELREQMLGLGLKEFEVIPEVADKPAISFPLMLTLR